MFLHSLLKTYYLCNLLLQNVSKFLTKWLLCYARQECWKVAFNKKTMEWWWAKNLSKLLLASSASRVFFRAQLTSFNHDFFLLPRVTSKAAGRMCDTRHNTAKKLENLVSRQHHRFCGSCFLCDTHFFINCSCQI